MVTAVRAAIDVFLSYSVADRDTATLVTNALVGGGLSVSPNDPPPGSNWQDSIWQSLTECDVFVVIINLERPHASNTFVELGAAVAWRKPVFAVQTSEKTQGIPVYFRDIPLFPLTRLDDLVVAIKRAVNKFPLEDRNLLLETYARLGVSTDQLLRDPEQVERLADEFASHASQPIAGEQLVNELLRLRKSGKLPTLRSRKPPG
jgi:hypothetical protein